MSYFLVCHICVCVFTYIHMCMTKLDKLFELSIYRDLNNKGTPSTFLILLIFFSLLNGFHDLDLRHDPYVGPVV